ncbi:hypothetical protein PK28_06585 [Hymenobacter sp. DG25B]|uniref:DUF5996 family protein n=1 Tax=Hymenobacter sp. DG25B TaxID=1385664 RepID=UPI000541282F|nr:DUF5996 family protein [Hymenobacter sp. DG25B]AIZ63437.1 hypothetical protein PK28_06585 [Hymenobacter sp. DG25B]
MPTPLTTAERWPALPAADWEPTRRALHMYLQIVGKTRLTLSPLVNHWWQVPFYVTPRGLTTSAMPYAGGSLEALFDFHDHELRLFTCNGDTRTLRLPEMKSVADFYEQYQKALTELGVQVHLWIMPVEVAELNTPFDEQTESVAYDADAVHRCWRILLESARVLGEFRGRFIGKSSPVHFFWGSFDLAVSRFSGRPAPPHPGGAPHLGQWVMQEAYSHEVSSAGWWPGGAGYEASYYSYVYPQPSDFAQAKVPAPAYYDKDLGEFILPYEAVRTAPNPEKLLLEFLESTYAAAASLGHWDRVALEREATVTT